MTSYSSPHAPLIIDVAGLALSVVDKKRLKHPLVGGVILFARNWQDRQQLSALCRQIKAVRKDLLILVDHEGGRVQRFKTDGFTHLPSMRRLGDMWMTPTKPCPVPTPWPPATPPPLAAMCWAPSCGPVAWT